MDNRKTAAWEIGNRKIPLKKKRLTAAVIGAAGESVHAMLSASSYGIRVVALDKNPKAEGLMRADLPLVVDISDEDAVIAALRVRGQKPDFVLPVPVGRYLTTAGAVNDALGLPGISRDMAVLCTDKFLFHKKLAECRLRRVHCYNVEGTELTDAAGGKYCGNRQIEEELPLQFPAILKPRYGSGSRGIHMPGSRKELTEILQTLPQEPYVLEECVPGEEYGVDGAVINGRFYMVLLRRKENTPFPARQAVAYYSVMREDKAWNRMRAYLKKVTVCLGLQECLLHADLIDGPKGPFVIELSARPSGHNLHDHFTRLCTDVDMVEEYIRHLMGLPCRFAPRKIYPMMIHYFDMVGKVRSVPTQEQVEEQTGAVVEHWDCRIRKGECLAPVSDGHGLMGRGYFILEGEDPAVLHDQAEQIKKMFF